MFRGSGNVLAIELHPAVAYATTQQQAYPYEVPFEATRLHRPFQLYSQSQQRLGWDWGPAFMPVGITGEVELVGFDAPV